MKIALIRYKEKTKNTRILRALQRRVGTVPHLGLAYIQTSLKKAGYESKIFDTEASSLTDAQLYNKLQDYSPKLVGVTTTTPGLSGALKACRISKMTGATVILGGPHTEIYSSENLVHPFIDFIGVGEGCTIMPHLAEALCSTNKEQKLKKISGLVSREFHNGYAKFLNLEEIGWPSRDGELQGNYSTILSKKPFTTMISSRGCPFRCSFCYKQKVDKNVLFRSADDIVNEMSFLVKRFKIREILLYDDVFTLDRNRVIKICELIIKRKLKVFWDAPTRADLVDISILKLMKAAGCIRLRFGIESGNPNILKEMRKSSNLTIMKNAVRSCRIAGIQAFGYFIVGYLNETFKQFQDTVKFACSLPLNYASFYVATPLPGTKLHSEAIDQNRFPKDYWDNYVAGKYNNKRANLLNPGAERRAKKAFYEFYFRFKMIPTITSKLIQYHSCMPVLSGMSSLALDRIKNFKT